MKAIEIDDKRCKKCGICIAFCPKAVFDKGESGQPVPTRQSECIGCKLCEKRCPDFALIVKECEG